jgi:hypothetical protein
VVWSSSYLQNSEWWKLLQYVITLDLCFHVVQNHIIYITGVLIILSTWVQNYKIVLNSKVNHSFPYMKTSSLFFNSNIVYDKILTISYRLSPNLKLIEV